MAAHNRKEQKMARSELTKEQHERQQLAQERAELQRETSFQLWLHKVYLKARNRDGQVLRKSEANDGLLRDFAGLSIDLAVEAIQKNASQFSWTDPPEKAEQNDRTAFTEFAKQNRYGDTVANFNLAREVLGAGNVTVYNLIRTVQDNRLRLAQATAQELADREEERIAQEQLRLRNADARTLRQEIRDGYADRVKVTQAAEAQRVLDAKQEAETGAGFPPLPEFYQGKRVDRDFFVKADRVTVRFFLQRYGDFQCTKRIRGL